MKEIAEILVGVRNAEIYIKKLRRAMIEAHDELDKLGAPRRTADNVSLSLAARIAALDNGVDSA